MQPDSECVENDLASNLTRMATFWGPGVLLMFLTGPLGGWERGFGWTIGLGWLAGMCLLNFARCRRVHCAFTGPFFLALAAVALLAGFGVLTFENNGWNLLGLIALVGGIALTYLPEMVWGHYWHRPQLRS